LRALAFDVFGTLFDVEGLKERVRGFTDRADDLVTLWRAKQLEYTFTLALMDRFMTFSEITRRALQYADQRLRTGLSPEQSEVLLAAWEDLPVYPDVAPSLNVLRERYAIVVLSNGDINLLERLLRRSGLRDLFSYVLSAEEVKTYKPSSRVYRLATDKLGLPPDQVGLVSSNAFDIMGAKAAGLRAFWVNRIGALMDPLGLEADVEVGDLGELVRSLEES
jgi:2-haloacid dehalogenase